MEYKMHKYGKKPVSQWTSREKVAYRGAFYAKQLKEKATIAETILLQELNKHKLKFQFQKYFYTENRCFIVDFFITYYTKRLVIEIDGKYHNTEKQKAYDEFRQNFLINERKCEVWRFTNEEVISDVKSIVKKILDKRQSFIPDNIKAKILKGERV